LLIAALLIGSYILGSIPFGLLIVNAFRGIDIRKYGSGNIGTTNVLRTAGRGPAVLVFITDVSKGLVPVIAAQHLSPGMPWMPVLAGLCAMVGHTTSIFLRFQGGKGAATGLGVYLGLNPMAAAIGFVIWILLIRITRYVSIASMIGAASIPVTFFIVHQPVPDKVFAIFATLYVVFKHRSNIRRLLQGTEAKWGEAAKVSEDSHAEEN
jgi:acyl phosphate:glycerol-3-phosphate acyltransferase